MTQTGLATLIYKQETAPNIHMRMTTLYRVRCIYVYIHISTNFNSVMPIYYCKSVISILYVSNRNKYFGLKLFRLYEQRSIVDENITMLLSIIFSAWKIVITDSNESTLLRQNNTIYN